MLEWFNWFRQQPFSFKWFLVVVLVRPFVDALWFVKKMGVFSPLQVIGVLTILLASVYSIKLKPAKKGLLPIVFIVFAVLLAYNQYLLVAESFSVQTIGYILRTISPIFIFFYLTRVITNRERLHGLLDTFLISSIFPLLMLFYEAIFTPINYVALPESRGGGYRLTGLYADLFSYMSFVIGDFFILSYYLFSRHYYSKLKTSIRYVLLVLVLTVFALLGLKHQASWGVFLAVILSFGVFISSSIVEGKKYALLLLILLVAGGPFLLERQLNQLFSKEIAAYNVEANQDRALNGRIKRWERYFATWDKLSLWSKGIGVSTSNLPFRTKFIMTSSGMHSDYVRFLFGTGIVGLMSFLLFYVTLAIKSLKLLPPERYFVVTSVLIFSLYSITANPFGSSGSLFYIIAAGFVIALQPVYKFYQVEL